MRTLCGTLALASTVAFTACGQGTHSINNLCPKVEAVGGDPTGKWGVANYCQINYARTATDDWCSKLVYDRTAVRDGLFLGTEMTKILKPSWIEFKWDPGIPAPDPNERPPCGPMGTCGTYESALVFGGPTTTIFPMGCLRQHQVDPTCLDLETKMRDLIEQNVLPTIHFDKTKPSDDPQSDKYDAQNPRCVPAATGDACACTYTVSTAGIATDLGGWRLEGNLLVTYPGTLAQAGIVDFFIDGSSMSMHGHDGMPLLAKDPLRNLDLVRCDDPDAIAQGLCPKP